MVYLNSNYKKDLDKTLQTDFYKIVNFTIKKFYQISKLQLLKCKAIKEQGLPRANTKLLKSNTKTLNFYWTKLYNLVSTI